MTNPSTPIMNDGPSVPVPQTPASESSGILDRSVTPTRSSPPTHPEFDPRIQVVLNQLTPAQISQLLSSISHTLDPPTTGGHNPPPASASSQITQYTPPLSDLFSQFVSPPSPVQLDKMENLLSFAEDDHTNRISKSWKSVHDVQGDVDGLNTDIETFARSLGLEYDHDKDATTPNFVPSASAPPVVSTDMPIIPSASLRIHTGPSDMHMDNPGPESHSDPSSRPSPSNSLFDIESLFGFQDAGEGYGDLSGETHIGPTSQSELPHPLSVLPLPQENPTVPVPAPQELSPGTKRKPDLAPHEAVLEGQAASPSSTTTLATRSSKRRKR